MLLMLRARCLALGQLWGHVPYPTRVPHFVFSPQPTHMVIVITGRGLGLRLCRDPHREGPTFTGIGIVNFVCLNPVPG